MAHGDSEARYRSLFEAAGAAIMLAELQADEIRFVDCNRSTLQLFRCDREDIIGTTLGSLSPATQPDGSSTRETALDWIAQALVSGPQVFEFRHQRLDGSQFDAGVTLNAMELDGVVHLQAIVRDITEEKRMRDELLRRQRLESIGRLAGGIAHNINTALTPIMLAVERIRSQTDNESIHRRLDTIDESADRAASLVRHVVSFARGVGGESSPLNPADLIERIAAFCELTFPRAIRVRNRIDNNPWPVLGVMGQLEQALLDLCLNAREAIADTSSHDICEGEISLAVRNVEIDENEAAQWLHAQAGRYVVMTVSDTGAGMTEEELQLIFDPFYTTKQSSAGIGLGLSAVQGIVTSHGGFVNARSEPGSGSSFEVWLPALDED